MRTEVTWGVNDTFGKNGLPMAIGGNSSCERVFGIHEPFGHAQASLWKILGHCGKEGRRIGGNFCRFVGTRVVSPHEEKGFAHFVLRVVRDDHGVDFRVAAEGRKLPINFSPLVDQGLVRLVLRVEVMLEKNLGLLGVAVGGGEGKKWPDGVGTDKVLTSASVSSRS